MRPRRSAPALIVLLVVVALLSACTSSNSKHLAPTRPPVNLDLPSVPIGTVATGTLRNGAGYSVGSVAVKYDGKYYLNLLSYTAPHVGQQIIVLVHDKVAFTECVDHKLTYETPIGGPTPAEVIAIDQPEYSGDPSFFRTVAIVQYPDSGPPNGACMQPTQAIATLTWTMPKFYPDLKVVDSGAGPGAIGTTGETVTGDVSTYTTHKGDAWSAIAARFGISQDELTYLNPLRPSGYEPNAAYTDEVLNLSRENR